MILLLLGAGTGPTQESAAKSPRALQVLAAANEATEAARSIRYRFRYDGRGAWAGSFRGTTWIQQREPLTASRFRTVATMDAPPAGFDDFPRRFEIATDSERAILIDHDRRRVDTASEALGANHLTRTLGYVVWYQFVQGDPYRWAMEGSETVEDRGRELVGGIECDVVHIVYPAGNVNREATWWFGVQDRLPRKQRLVGELAGGLSPSFTFVLEALATGLDLDASEFRPAPPHGYAVTDSDDRSMQPGSPSPHWTARTTSGEAVELRDLRGQVVVLDFWSSWSTAGERLMSGIQELHQAFEDAPVRVLGVNVWETGDPAAVMAARGAAYDTLVDAEHLADLYKIMWQPAVVVIGPRGRILFREQGVTEDRQQRVREVVEEALEER